jgi:general secretion pathway protein F
MPLLSALDAARETTGDVEISRRLGMARDAVARGTPLKDAIGSATVLSPVAVQLVGAGEASGRLGPMVERAGRVAGEEAERLLRAAVGLIEPMLVILLGVLVASVAAALLQAVYGIRPPV